MRQYVLLFAIIAIHAAVVPASAQVINSGQASGFFTGVNPRQINFQPIDVSSRMRAGNVSRAFRNVQGNQPSGIGRFFPRLTLGSWPPRIPFAPFLSRNQNPFQPNPIRGRDPFNPPASK